VKVSSLPSNVQKKAILSELWVYPIKSCPGFTVDSWRIGQRGFIYDREWLLVSSQDQIPLSTKHTPQLSQLSTFVDIDQNVLVIKTTTSSLKIHLDEYPETPISLQVCGDVCEGRIYSNSVSEWFTSVLGISCKLVRKSTLSDRRQSSLACISNFEISFSNESQYLLISAVSLSDLRQRISSKSHDGEISSLVTTKNFRPNLVVDTADADQPLLPYEEDNWKFVECQDSGVQFQVVGQCNRCQTICLDPQTGSSIQKKEPLLTLSSYRRQKGRIFFGSHLSVHTLGNETSLLKKGAVLRLL